MKKPPLALRRGQNLSKSHQFTLIELLMVIAIIAILLSMFLPSLSKSKDLAKAAVCSGNSSQNNKAMTLYLVDNDMTFPSYRGLDSSNIGSVTSWIGISGTSGNYQDFSVTNKPLNVYLGYDSDGDYVNPARCNSSDGSWMKTYGTDIYANVAWPSNDLYDSRKLGKIRDTSRMLSFYESGAWYYAQGRNVQKLEHHNQKKGRYNMTFLDGHVNTLMHIQPMANFGEYYTFDNFQ